MAFITYGRQQARDFAGQQGDCGCGGLGPDCIESKTPSAVSMDGSFTESLGSGIGTGAGIVAGVCGAAWLLSKIFAPK